MSEVSLTITGADKSGLTFRTNADNNFVIIEDTLNKLIYGNYIVIDESGKIEEYIQGGNGNSYFAIKNEISEVSISAFGAETTKDFTISGNTYYPTGGATDSTIAFQDTIDSLIPYSLDTDNIYAEQTHPFIVTCAGTYLITDTITANKLNYFKLRNHGALLWNGVENGKLFDFCGLNKSIIEDLHIYGNNLLGTALKMYSEYGSDYGGIYQNFNNIISGNIVKGLAANSIAPVFDFTNTRRGLTGSTDNLTDGIFEKNIIYATKGAIYQDAGSGRTELNSNYAYGGNKFVKNYYQHLILRNNLCSQAKHLIWIKRNGNPPIEIHSQYTESHNRSVTIVGTVSITNGSNVVSGTKPSTTLTGTASVDLSVDSRKLVGSGTAFLTELEVDKYYTFGNHVHRIGYIVSNTEAYTEEEFRTNISGATIYEGYGTCFTHELNEAEELITINGEQKRIWAVLDDYTLVTGAVNETTLIWEADNFSSSVSEVSATVIYQGSLVKFERFCMNGTFSTVAGSATITASSAESFDLLDEGNGRLLVNDEEFIVDSYDKEAKTITVYSTTKPTKTAETAYVFDCGYLTGAKIKIDKGLFSSGSTSYIDEFSRQIDGRGVRYLEVTVDNASWQNNNNGFLDLGRWGVGTIYKNFNSGSTNNEIPYCKGNWTYFFKDIYGTLDNQTRTLSVSNTYTRYNNLYDLQFPNIDECLQFVKGCKTYEQFDIKLYNDVTNTTNIDIHDRNISNLYGNATICGLASIANGSAIVTGSGSTCNYLRDLQVGDSITINGETKTVSTVDSLTQFTCSANFSSDASDQVITLNTKRKFTRGAYIHLYNCQLYSNPATIAEGLDFRVAAGYIFSTKNGLLDFRGFESTCDSGYYLVHHYSGISRFGNFINNDGKIVNACEGYDTVEFHAHSSNTYTLDAQIWTHSEIWGTTKCSNINIISDNQTAPTTGGWQVGTRYIDTSPASGQYLGFLCTTDGTPGVWKGFGAVV